MTKRVSFGLALVAALLASCQEKSERGFPTPDRAVSKTTSLQYSNEARRDRKGEAEAVMDRAGVRPGMTVADVGAGNGYYTVRLAERVGQKGRVVAQDIDPRAIRSLGTRIERERLDKVFIVTGDPADPKLPKRSFDRIFLVHMYHEVEHPYEFLWNLYPALKPGGEIIVVDRDQPTNAHGLPPKLLFCEFEAVGLTLNEFAEQPELGGYFASFKQGKKRPEPSKIEPCTLEAD